MILAGLTVHGGCAATRGDADCAAAGHGGTCLETSLALDPPKAGIVDTYRCVDPLPGEAVPAPPGSYNGAWGRAMGSQAAFQGEIITRNLWFDGGQQLGPDGRERLAKIADSFAAHPRLVLIEEEPVAIASDQTYQEAMQANARLNTERKIAVIESLASLGIPDAEDLVYFTSDRSIGVRGVEAPNIFNRQFTGAVGGRGMGGRGGIGGVGGLGGVGGFGSGIGGGMLGGGFGGGGIF